MGEIKMDKKELEVVLENHKKWLGGDGERADLRGAHLQEANLQWANLREADLQQADLRGANLRWANLRGAHLQEADLDFSCLPLWCGSLGVHFDEKQLIQVLYHVCYNVKFSKHSSDALKEVLLSDEVLALANKFHRVDECGKITK